MRDSAISTKIAIARQNHSLISHPPHYTDGGIETWDFIAAKQLDYFLGNAVKYISRAGKKRSSTAREDIQKAIAYLEKKLTLLRKQ